MHIQVIAPNVDTRFTNHPNTFELPADTFRNASPLKQVHSPSATYGTPIRFTRAKTAGACPCRASPYSVREPIYRSEFAALRTKTRMQALMI